MSDNYRNNFQIIQTFQMKVLQCGSPKSNKLNKRINLPVYAHTKCKQTPIDENEEYLSPIHIKLANYKVKPKNEAKIQKHESSIDDRRTKRKQTKKLSMELNSTIVVNDFPQKKVNKKQQENQKPTKTAEKTQRKTPKSENKKINKNQWLVDSQQKIMRNLMQKKKKKIPLIKQQIPIISNQEYLFISDKFFLVNNLNPAKKLLNTFSQNCKKEHPDSKFITQDKKDRIKLKSMEKKTNIFTEVRKEIELNNKIKKATKIQRWWRRFSTIKNLTKTKPQYVQQQNQQLNISQSKLSFKQREQSQKKSPFQMSQSNSSPIKDKIQNGEDSIIASFHSAEKLIEESLPKKILFTKDDLSKLIVPAYKLPSIQVSADENEAIFSSYAKFKIQQTNNENVSSDLSLLTPPKQQASLITGDQDSFQQQIKDQWSPNKVIDPQIDIIKEFQEATRIKEQIEFRAAFQKGIIKPIDTFNSKVGISTSILGIHSFLVNFFNFYIQKYQDQFINLINMPYGHSINARLRSVQGYNLPQQIEQDDQGVVFGVQEIIDQQKLEQFYSNRLQTGKNITNFTKANLQLQKIHNKSVIDLLNELLNQYRPYKQINGIPYPWNHSYKALTFYYVTEDNITQVFEKVQIKILKDSSLLAGIMLPYNQRNQQSVQKAELDTALFTQNYIKNHHPLVYQFNQEKQVKCIHEEIKSDSFEFDNEALTKLLIQISNEIFDQLTLQNASELKDNKIICFN